MSAITDKQLLDYNTKGLIPGPGESENTFLQRAHFCLSLSDTLSSQMETQIPFHPHEKASLSFFAKGAKKSKKIFNISPDWIPIFFSNYRLYPWHGACAWIFQLTETSPISAFLQLRKKLHNRPTLFGCYERDELISHELCHVGRMAFEEPQFEEIFAYKTATSLFRRYFGPLFQSSLESLVFVLVFMGIIALDLYLILQHPDAYWQALWVKAIPLAMLLFGLGRLWKKHRTFSQARQQLQTIVSDLLQVDAVLYRLTDQEIRSFAHLRRSKIVEIIRQQSQTSLRWRLLALAYFPHILKRTHQPPNSAV